MDDPLNLKYVSGHGAALPQFWPGTDVDGRLIGQLLQASSRCSRPDDSPVTLVSPAEDLWRMAGEVRRAWDRVATQGTYRSGLRNLRSLAGPDALQLEEGRNRPPVRSNCRQGLA